MILPKMKINLTWIIVLLFYFADGQLIAADPDPVVLSPLFSDNMVLQRELPVKIWGEAGSDDRITVRIAGQEQITRSDSTGSWQVILNPIKAGGPFTLEVKGDIRVLIKNVMVGEVWLASGQSNMEMPLAGWGKIHNFQEETARADYSDIRLFTVERNPSTYQVNDIISSGWQVCSSETVPLFSATAYFFGREIHQEMNVPIGLIHSSWGGTVAEAWMSADVLKTHPDFRNIVEYSSEIDSVDVRYLYEQELIRWNDELNRRDKGWQEEDSSWFENAMDRSDWSDMQLPIVWERAGYPDLDGVAWFSRTIEIPERYSSQDAILYLGPIDDIDITWFNGEEIGSTGVWDAPRIYKVPSRLIKTGANTIVIRVIDYTGLGGIYGEPSDMHLDFPGEKFSLAGDWQFKVGVKISGAFSPPVPPDDPNRPTVLYNGMIAPLTDFTIRGVIWYQGESNTGRAYQYQTLFPLLITNWREKFNQPEMPFLFVQLANWQEKKPRPSEDQWAELREAQLNTLALPGTGMAVTIDIGDAVDIHPKNKQEVGRRLALIALNQVYGENIPYSGPIYRSSEIVDGQVYLYFDHAEGGLTTSGGNIVSGFSIAGADRKFIWAVARIDSEKVIIQHPRVKYPAAVRYSWEINPDGNLINKQGLPASPFRTDQWPGVTH